LYRAYERATVAVVPLLPNLHASGITAIQEGVLAGVPVIATDVGGLRAYFSDDEITFIPEGDAAALRDAVARVAKNSEEANVMVQRAQTRIADSEVNASSYIRRHVELSKELVK
jgi:glycosyltransferase involved in cell wall biosynthesis